MSDTPSGGPVDRRGLSDEMREMLDQSEREYVGWNPEESPQIIGTISDISPDCDCGGYGSHNIIFIDTPRGEGIAVHAFHTTLRSQIDPRIRTGRLGVGDLIAISHLGTKQSGVKGHADMNMYRVVVRQKQPALRFTQDGEEYR
jgi:hypothetical protein